MRRSISRASTSNSLVTSMTHATKRTSGRKEHDGGARDRIGELE